MTPEAKALWGLYERMFSDDYYPWSASDKQEIADEMRRVLSAPSVEDAAKVIEWWDSFYGRGWNRSARACAAEIRRRGARLRQRG